MDNQKRAEAKLAPSMDRNTEVTAVAGLQIAGPWFQPAPEDFFAAPVAKLQLGVRSGGDVCGEGARTGTGRARLRGPACTETICKNIDVTLAVPSPTSGVPGFDVKDLAQMR